MPSYSGVWTLPAQYQAIGLNNWPSPPLVARGLFNGGYNGSSTTSAIQYIEIATTGNATSFGNLSTTIQYSSACASSTRGVIFTGATSSNTSDGVNTMQYVTISTTGNSTFFGDLQALKNYYSAACNSATRGLITGGNGNYNTIVYITIATTGDAASFGNIGGADLIERQASCSSSTRGLFAGGTDINTGSAVDRIMYSTIATLGAATTFGTLSGLRTAMAACSSSTRGVFGGGQLAGTVYNIIEYVTIATTGNDTDFGDLTAARRSLAGCSSAVRGVFGGGGDTGGTPQSNINYITIATTGDATNFGNLITAVTWVSGLSNNNGGTL